MKKTVIILCLLLALTLFTACGENANEQAKQPQLPDSPDSSDPLANIPKPSAPDAPGPCTPPEDDNQDIPDISYSDKGFEKVILKNHLKVAGYTAEGLDFPERDYEFTLTKSGTGESTVDKLFFVLQKVDKERGAISLKDLQLVSWMQREELPFSAEFYTSDSEETLTIHFKYASNEDFVAVKMADGKIYLLTDEGKKELVELLNTHGMTEETFLIDEGNAITSMFEWSWSLSGHEPLILDDAARQLTPEQAAERLMDELAKELCETAPNRFFYYENYKGWDIRVISSQSKEYKNNEYYRGMNLAENQYVIAWGEIDGTRVGIGNDGGPSARFVMEYAEGQWILYPRERAS